MENQGMGFVAPCLVKVAGCIPPPVSVRKSHLFNGFDGVRPCKFLILCELFAESSQQKTYSFARARGWWNGRPGPCRFFFHIIILIFHFFILSICRVSLGKFEGGFWGYRIIDLGDLAADWGLDKGIGNREQGVGSRK
jgi:hypothetical protein